MASNRVVDFEIPANQPAALTKFYSDLFGWNFHGSGPRLSRAATAVAPGSVRVFRPGTVRLAWP